MPSIVELAVQRYGKAMTELYESNKEQVYAFCRVFVDEDKAAEFTQAVMNESFALAATENVVSEEAYTAMVMREAAKRIAPNVLDGNAPQAENTAPKAKFVRAGAVFNGSVDEGVAHLNETLDKLSAYQRFTYLCAVVGGLSTAEIGAAMGEREAIARYCLETAAYIMSRMKAGAVRTDQIASLYKKQAEEWVLPAETDAACRQFIAQNTVRQVPLWKIFVPIAAVLAVATLVLVLILSNGGLTFTSGTSGDKGTTTTTTKQEGLIHGETSLDLSKTYYADIDIQDQGVITVKLDPVSAPITVENFVTLAQDDFYDGLTFHRIIEGFMMQGGDPKGDGTGGSDKDIIGEFTSNGYDNTLKHTRGAISMARATPPDSASSQFFIMHETDARLDGKYATFGYVTKGMEIVDAICEAASPIDSNGSIARSEQPVINSIDIRIE